MPPRRAMPHHRGFVILVCALLIGPLTAAPLGVSADLLSGGLQDEFILETDPDHDAFQVDFSVRIQRAQVAPPANVTFRYAVTLTPTSGGRAISTSLTDSLLINGIHDQVVNPVVELDPQILINGSYTLNLQVYHVEDPDFPATFSLDARMNVPYANLVSFSGVLEFGAVSTTLHELANPPVPDPVEADTWTIVVAQGTLSSGFTFANTGNSTASLTVLRDSATGDLGVLSGSAEIDDGDGSFPWGDSEGTRQGPVLIDPTAIEAESFSLDLPPGLGWRDGEKGILRSVFDSEGTALSLDEDLDPSATVIGAVTADREFISDVLSVAFTPPSFSFDGTSLTLRRPATRFLRYDRYRNYFSKKGTLPRANDSYLYFLVSPAASDLVVTPGAGGGITVTLDIDNGFFPTHFPDAGIDGTGATLRYLNNELDPSTSTFAANWIRLQYEQGCPDLGTTQRQGMRILNPAISFTPEGGLTATGALATPAQFPGTERHLVAGLNDGNPVHQTDQFTDAEFYLPAFCAPSEGAGVDPNPARYLLAETQPDNAFALGYPESPAYAAGEGLYAGFNYFHFEGLQAESRVAGEAPVSYDLLSNAKFYNRRSGVSGIIEADPAALPFNLTLYQFPISFTDWGFNLLSNEMLDSYIDGQVDLSATHAGFVQAMEEVIINCCGNLEDFQVPNGVDPTHTLAYWFGSRFDYSHVRFETPEACVDDRAVLTYAATATINGLPGAKGGYLRFLNDGTMTVPADPDFEASVLKLQPQDGVHDQYYFWPEGHAYFNHPSSFPAGPGFVALQGYLDVAFFENMPVGGHSTTNPGGDPQRLDGFFHGRFLNAEDLQHDGLPAGMTPEQYRASVAHRPHAIGSFFGKQDTFDFPVVFNGPTGNFYSPPQGNTANLIIVETESGVDRLNAKLAQIHFGLTIDGLANFTIGNLIEEATEYGAAGLAGVIAPTISEALSDGLLALAQILDNRLETLLVPALEQAVSATITTELAQDIQALGPGWDGNGPALDAVLTPYFGDPLVPADGGLLQDALETFQQFEAGAEQVAGVAEELRQRLDHLQQALDCAVALLGGQLGEHQNAFLTQIFDYFVEELELNPDVGQITGTQAYTDALDSLTNSSNLGWLADARGALVQLSETVGEVRDFLALGQEFFEEIENVFSNAADVLNAVNNARSQLRNRIISEMAGQVDDFSLAEIEEAINAAIRDQFFESVLAVNLQSILRARLSYLDTAVQEALTIALQAVTEAILDVLQDTPPLEAIQDSLAATEELFGMLSVVKSIGLRGEAMTCDDRIRQLCLQAGVDLGLPTPGGINIPMEFDVLFKYLERESNGSAPCLAPAASVPEVTLSVSGGTAIGLGVDSTASAEVKFTFDEFLVPTGFAGSINVSQSDFNVTAMGITDLSATLALGGSVPGTLEEYYLGAFAMGNFGVGPVAAKLEGGFLMGKVCAPALPLDAFYPEFPHLPEEGGSATLIAAYMSGKFPLLGGGCLFNVTAGAGVGGFVVLGQQGAGGLLEGSISGELLCLAKAEGSIDLAYNYLEGAPDEPGEDPDYQNGTHRFDGGVEAKLRLGRKPFAIEKSTSFDVEYTKVQGQSPNWIINP